jgi:hypothetical protein
MDRINITTNFKPQVTVDEVGGHLQIKGWVRSEVFARASAPGNLKYEETEDGVRLSCKGDLVLRLPREASLKIGKVSGSLRAKYLDRGLEAENIAGSLGLRQVGELHIESVSGDVLVKQALGDLHIGAISGSAILRDVQGNCRLDQVAGNLDIREARGDLLAKANGHVNLQTGLLDGEQYAISAGGNLHCQVPEEASLHVKLTSQAGEINVIEAGQNETFNQTQHELTLGEGAASMELSAAGKLLFTTTQPEWQELEDFDQVLNEEFTRLSEELTHQIGSQIEAHMNILNENLEKLADTLQDSGISAELADRLIWQARATGDRVTTHAQEKMRRAQEKIERKLAAAQRKAEWRAKMAQDRGERRHRHNWHVDWTYKNKDDEGAKDAPASSGGVSDAERLAVLRMLEKKTITSQEADRLLAALEGKSE